jgi:hypothetical protein
MTVLIHGAGGDVARGEGMVLTAEPSDPVAGHAACGRPARDLRVAGDGNEWQTWRRSLHDFAPRLFQQ